jgi:hypothetical protein
MDVDADADANPDADAMENLNELNELESKLASEFNKATLECVDEFDKYKVSGRAPSLKHFLRGMPEADVGAGGALPKLDSISNLVKNLPIVHERLIQRRLSTFFLQIPFGKRMWLGRLARSQSEELSEPSLSLTPDQIESIVKKTWKRHKQEVRDYFPPYLNVTDAQIESFCKAEIRISATMSNKEEEEEEEEEDDEDEVDSD